jgi:hypothetical protein
MEGSRGPGESADLAILPGSECLVGRNSGCIFLFCREEMTLDEPADCVLRGALAETDVFGEFLIADLDVSTALFGSARECVRSVFLHHYNWRISLRIRRMASGDLHGRQSRVF